jgi:transcriptional regulator with XRE-family HTH domain
MAPATIDPTAITDASGMTQEPVVYIVAAPRASQVADAVGITRSHMSMILAGKRMPSLPLARKISQVMGISTDELYDRIIGNGDGTTALA